jgi:hypothetical protein
MIDERPIRTRYQAVRSSLSERGRRLHAAAEAVSAGHGGIAAASRATKVARSTISRGLKDLKEPVLLQSLALAASRLRDGSGQLTSRSNLEQLGDESSLSPDVTSADISKLPFPDHRHRLIARQRSSRRPEAAEAKPWAN